MWSPTATTTTRPSRGSAFASTSASRPRRSWSSTAPAPTSLAIQALARPHEAVICPATAHLNVDECGAPERIAGVKLLAGRDRRRQAHPRPGGGQDHRGRRPARLPAARRLDLPVHRARHRLHAGGDRAPWPTSPTSHQMYLHVDGARLANAAAALDLPLRALTTDAGVDVLSFGGTKNGLLLGDAIVFLRPELARDFLFIRKQSMQLASKMRFLAVQFDALLGGDLWRRNASHANAMAAPPRRRHLRGRRRRARLPGPGQRRLRHPARRGDRAPARRAPGGAPLLRLGRGRRDDPPHVLVGHDRGGRRRPGAALEAAVS